MFVKSISCQTASASKKPAKRGPKPKQIGSLDYCRVYGCWLYVDSTGQSSRSLKATGNLFVKTSWRCYKTKVKNDLALVLPFRKQLDQSSRLCSPCNNKVRSTCAGFSFIKTSFQESEHYDDSFRFKLKECRHYVDQWFRGKVMQWLKHHLLSFLSLLQLDPIPAILFNNYSKRARWIWDDR